MVVFEVDLIVSSAGSISSVAHISFVICIWCDECIVSMSVVSEDLSGPKDGLLFIQRTKHKSAVRDKQVNRW